MLLLIPVSIFSDFPWCASTQGVVQSQRLSKACGTPPDESAGSPRVVPWGDDQVEVLDGATPGASKDFKEFLENKRIGLQYAYQNLTIQITQHFRAVNMILFIPIDHEARHSHLWAVLCCPRLWATISIYFISPCLKCINAYNMYHHISNVYIPFAKYACEHINTGYISMNFIHFIYHPYRISTMHIDILYR